MRKLINCQTAVSDGTCKHVGFTGAAQLPFFANNCLTPKLTLKPLKASFESDFSFRFYCSAAKERFMFCVME